MTVRARGRARLIDWREEDAKRVAKSFAVFLRKRKTGDAALDAFTRHFTQLKKLFDEVEGFEAFFLVFGEYLCLTTGKANKDLIMCHCINTILTTIL